MYSVPACHHGKMHTWVHGGIEFIRINYPVKITVESDGEGWRCRQHIMEGKETYLLVLSLACTMVYACPVVVSVRSDL